MRTTTPGDYDRWLTTDTRYEAAQAAQDAFEAWVDDEGLDLDWDDDDAVGNAFADFEAEMEDRCEAREIDADERRAEARWEREMDRI